MDCRCTYCYSRQETLGAQKAVISGEDALTYANEHLRRVRVNFGSESEDYLCAATGIEWVLDRPRTDNQLRLRVKLTR